MWLLSRFSYWSWGNALNIGSDEILLCTEPQFKSFPRSWIRSLDYSYQFFQNRNFFLNCEVDMVTEEVVDNKEEVVNWSLGWFVLLNISGVNFFNSMCANLRVCKVYTLILQAKIKGASICREANTLRTCIRGSSEMVGAGQVCLPQLSTIFSIIIHEFICM